MYTRADLDFEKPALSKALFAGLFAGISATLISLLYNFICREITTFSPSQIVNVSSIIFGCLIISMIAGLIFLLFIKKRPGLFTILYLFITVALLVITLNADMLAGRKDLLIGIELISGICNAVLIPLFSRHSEVFI